MDLRYQRRTSIISDVLPSIKNPQDMRYIFKSKNKMATLLLSFVLKRNLKQETKLLFTQVKYQVENCSRKRKPHSESS